MRELVRAFLWGVSSNSNTQNLPQQEQGDKINYKMAGNEHFDVPILLIISREDEPDKNRAGDINKRGVTKMGQTEDQRRNNDR